MARTFLLSFEAHSCSYVTKMIDKTYRQGAFAVADVLPRRLLARFIREMASIARRALVSQGIFFSRSMFSFTWLTDIYERKNSLWNQGSSGMPSFSRINRAINTLGFIIFPAYRLSSSRAWSVNPVPLRQIYDPLKLFIKFCSDRNFLNTYRMYKT